MRLAHLTDPHLTPLPEGWPGGWPSKRWMSWLSWQRRRRHVHRHAHLDALIDAVRTEAPDLWAVTGDLCQTGTREEIDVATAWLERLAPAEQILLTPGNHDVFARGSRARVDADWAPWLHQPTERIATRRCGPATVIAVDSAIVTPIASARGRVGAAGRARLAETLDRARGTFRVVLIHHPPTPGLCKRRKALADDTELAALLREKGAGLVLHGHLHHDRRHDLSMADGTALPVFCTPSASATDAAARLFDIEPEGETFRVRMRLLRADGVSDASSWSSPG